MLALAAVLFVPGTAAASGGGRNEARDQVQQARVLVDRALDQARAGNRPQAYKTARTAYLDHFERAEIPLRLRAPNLVLDLEFRFAELRNGIRDGKSIGSLEDTAASLRDDLRSVDRTLSDPGFAAPVIAFLFSFTILFREGLEAVLLIAILLGSLQAGRASGFRKPLGLGVAAAVGATAVTWLAATLVIDIAPVQRELLEAGTAVLAVGVLFVVTFWLVAQLEQRRRIEFMRARVAGAIAAGSTAAFAGLGFTAVYREGFETVLFYQALALFAEGLIAWVVLGVVAAAAALGVVGYAILRLGKRLPIKPLLMTGASILLLLSVAFAGNAVRSFQEGDMVGVTPVAGGWARLPVFVAELTGIHPTREGLGVQAAMLALYVAGAAYMFAWRPLRRRVGRVAQA
jgi:high-affinity iron transporter